MNWPDLGGALAKAGAPVIGRALGGPLGELIANQLGGFIASSLGVEGAPDAVDRALRERPANTIRDTLAAADAEAAERWPALVEIEKAWADAAVRSLAETQITMRAEAASGDLVQRWWRPIYALETVFECAVLWIVVLADIKFAGGKIAAFIVAAQGLLTTYWSARFGVFGVYVGVRSIEKITGTAADKLAPSVIDQIVKTVRRR